MSDSINLTEHLTVIKKPERITSVESWHRHIPFAFVLLKLLKPGVFVELGTHRGDSYSAFCQGVVDQGLSTKCFAVDTWQGDSQAGLYDDSVYEELCAWHDPRYSHFSTLMRMSFDSALDRFADNSVDLLHIDGLHTYDAVRHDFETWLPKMSDYGVIIFHDTVVRHSDFEVWRFWQEVSELYPSFEFKFGFGLGVLAVGQQVAQEVIDFIKYSNNNAALVNNLFYALGDSIALYKANEVTALLKEQVNSLGEQLTHARQVVVERDYALDLRPTCEDQYRLEKNLKKYIALNEQHIKDISVLNDIVNNNLDELRKANLVTSSKLWRFRNALMLMLGMRNRVISIDYPEKSKNKIIINGKSTVDIIVPVYRNFELTKRCIESVLNSDLACNYQLIVINDYSPETEITLWLKEQSENKRFTLIENTENKGFVKTVNFGMSLNPDHDVVLLNSDTEVTGNWLDRLQSAAYSSADVGTVTPFSNNATICSYPGFCKENELPENISLSSLDKVFSEVNQGNYIDIPTAVGFCMYIRRDCLSESGLFNADLFGKGYGEENEFCLRSSELGWRHLLAGDVFVLHKGGVSFADTQSENQRLGKQALDKVYPQYDLLIQQHVQLNPAARLRFSVDIELTKQSGLPVVLMISHQRGGGTAKHIGILVDQLKDQAICYELTPVEENGKVRLGRYGNSHNQMVFDPHCEFPALLLTLKQLGISRIHFHHTIGVAAPIINLPKILSCPYDITVHDYYYVCPQISMTKENGKYCGAPDQSGCNACLASRPAPGNVDIDTWRRFGEILLNGAERVFLPSIDTHRRMLRYIPNANYIIAKHEGEHCEASPTKLEPFEEGKTLRVIVIGALGVIKGADLLESVALLAREKRVPIEFHLVGFAYRELHSYPFSSLFVHGEYEDEHLQQILQSLQPDIVWFPGSCPETYSYTLSACLDLNLPIVAPRIGAFPERLHRYSGSWLFDVDPLSEEMLNFLLEVRSKLVKFSVNIGFDNAAEPALFDYALNYCKDIKAKRNDENITWQELHITWLSLSGYAGAVARKTSLLVQVIYFALRSYNVKKALNKVPVSVRFKFKKWLFG